VLVREARTLSPWAYERLQEIRRTPPEAFDASLPGPLGALWTKGRGILSFWNIDLQNIVLKNLDQLGGQISMYGTRLLKNIAFLLFDLAIAGFTLFFLFRDGDKIVRKIMDLLPMERSHKEHILQRLGQTLSAVVHGLFITASAQGLLAGLGYVAVGIKFSVLLGFATAFMALVPLVGPATVWLPVGIFLLLKGSMIKGVLLLSWGLLVVSMIDNFLKPFLIGEKAKLPFFLLFFGMLGGLQAYGVIGILVGPLMIASVLAFANIYRDQMGKISAKE
jgi:predicted PurR-regulated permease PerM